MQFFWAELKKQAPKKAAGRMAAWLSHKKTLTFLLQFQKSQIKLPEVLIIMEGMTVLVSLFFCSTFYVIAALKQLNNCAQRCSHVPV